MKGDKRIIVIKPKLMAAIRLMTTRGLLKKLYESGVLCVGEFFNTCDALAFC